MLFGTAVGVPVSALLREGSDENCPALACGDPGGAPGGACRAGADPRRRKDRAFAARAGLSIETAQAAASTLQGQELQDLASQARQVNDDLVGGASTVTISTTTIIIVLLIIILIVLIAD